MRSFHLAFSLIFLSLVACQQIQENGLPMAVGLALSSPAAKTGCTKLVATNIIFQSADGGQTWHDISAGLPEGLQAQRFFASDDGLFLGAENGVYRSSTTAVTPVWDKEISLNPHSNIVSAGQAGVFAVNYSGGFFQKLYNTDIWMPMFTDFEEHSIHTVFEAKDGAIFIGCENGLFKSADGGKTWKHVVEDGWVIHIVESNGVLLCTNERGILRSANGGEHWDVVVSEGGVGIAVEVIEGGFAAITYNTESETRRVRTSTDGGKTWQAIDAGLPPSMLIASIKQVGKYFLCGHPDGIFRSADNGKTWELLKPSIGKKVFNLSVSGNMVYAVAMDGGC
ncbi:MAG: exo-alpha-sialidase [Saprospiraceae bacterium]